MSIEATIKGISDPKNKKRKSAEEELVLYKTTLDSLVKAYQTAVETITDCETSEIVIKISQAGERTLIAVETIENKLRTFMDSRTVNIDEIRQSIMNSNKDKNNIRGIIDNENKFFENLRKELKKPRVDKGKKDAIGDAEVTSVLTNISITANAINQTREYLLTEFKASKLLEAIIKMQECADTLTSGS